MATNVLKNTVMVSNVIDNCESTSATNPLSANQGKVLDDKISSLNQAIDAYAQALNGIGLDIENGTLVIEPVTA